MGASTAEEPVDSAEEMIRLSVSRTFSVLPNQVPCSASFSGFCSLCYVHSVGRSLYQGCDLEVYDIPSVI